MSALAAALRRLWPLLSMKSVDDAMSSHVRALEERIAGVLKDEAAGLRPHQISRRLREEDGRRVQVVLVERTIDRAGDRFRRDRNGRWTLKESPVKGSEFATSTDPRARDDHGVVTPRWPALEPPLYPWQVDALNAWAANGRKGIVQAVTGAGKTPVGIAAARHQLDEGGRAIVVVPTIELMHQWVSACAKWLALKEEDIGRLGGGYEDRLAAHRITVAVAASAARHIPDQVRQSLMPVLLVADECHRYGAETYGRTLDAPYAATLGLSATPTRNDGETERTLIPAIGPIVYRLRYGEALAAGVINPFEIVFLALPFTPRERSEYEKQTDEITDRLERLQLRYPQLADSDRLFEDLEKIFEQTQDPLIRALQASVSRRQSVLQGATLRKEAAIALVGPSDPERKTILFHERIEEAEELAAELTAAGVPAAAHHSGLTKVQRREVLTRFSRGFIRALVAPRTLDEGIDVPDADLGVIVAGSKQVRQRIQRAGRVLRKAPGKGSSRVILFYVEQTVEDPRAGRDADAFVDEIASLGRAVWREWPRDRADILRTLGSDPTRAEA